MSKTIRHAYIRSRISQDFSGDTRTKQSMKAECDINNIMKRYVKTGNISHFSKHAGYYDFCPEIDYRGALELLNQAQEMFEDLPAPTRKRFDNDPGKFLGWIQDPKNLDEARELGLANPKKPTPPVSKDETGTPPKKEG